MKYMIREIEEKDNKAIENIIRACLIEFHANQEGTAWADPNLGNFFEVYSKPKCQYWVAQDGNGKVVGGVGIGAIEGISDTCELQKMYCLQEARGTGVADELIIVALAYAKQYYKQCYLETLDTMVAAQKFYEKHGFKRLFHPLINTGHYACDVRYSKELQ